MSADIKSYLDDAINKLVTKTILSLWRVLLNSKEVNKRSYCKGINVR